MARRDAHAGDNRTAEPDASRRRHQFAQAITRAEFGRFYWNDDLERELRGPAASRCKRPDQTPRRTRKPD